MDPIEQKWLDAALSYAVRAQEKGLLVLLVRTQDVNGAADLIVTNAASPDLIKALWPDATESE